MAKQKYQKVKFTGKRTGLETIPINGFGVVARGDTITVPAETAERWLAVVATDADGKESVDWDAAGGSFTAEKSEAYEAIGKERERAAERAAAQAPEEPVAEAGAAAEAATEEGAAKS